MNPKQDYEAPVTEEALERDRITKNIYEATTKLDVKDALGISQEKATENYIDMEYSDYLAKFPTEEKSKRRKRINAYYLQGKGKQFIDTCLMTLKSQAQSVLNTVDNIRSAVVSFSASNALPPTIVAGSATGAPNPAWNALDNRQKVKSILSLLDNATTALVGMYTIFGLLHLEPPKAVSTAVTSLASITALTKKLPI